MFSITESKPNSQFKRIDRGFIEKAENQKAENQTSEEDKSI
jgi:hypothetical protein